MRKYLVLFTAFIGAVLAIFVLTPAGKAQHNAEGIDEANKYFNQRLYSKAIEAYKPLLQSKNSDERYEAELKTALAYSRQFKYDEALKQIYSYKVPSDKLWEARYYLVKYDLLNNSPYYAPSEQETQTNPTKFTSEQKKEAKKEILIKLWDMRKQLSDMPYAESKEYTPNTYSGGSIIPEAAKFPTLFDYLIGFWGENEVKPQAEIYEEAYKIKGKNRSAAAELWHIERINLIDVESKEFLKIKANWMLYISGMTNAYDQSYDIKKYIFAAQETLPKTYAAYNAASIYNELQNYEEAIKVADYCIGLELNVITEDCKRLKQNIMAPQLSFGDNSATTAPNQEYNLKVNTRNLDKFYINIYKLTTADLKDTSGRYNTYDARTTGKKPIRRLTISVVYDKPYAMHTSNIVLPKETSGFYKIELQEQSDNTAAAKNDYNMRDNAIIVNYTDIALGSTAYAKAKNLTAQTSLGNFYNIYALDAKTGEPKQGVKLEANTGKPSITGKDGQSIIMQNKHNNLNILASKAGNYAILDNLWFNKYQKDKYIMAINTDMAIYRAGGTIKVQLTAAEFKGEHRYLLAENKTVKLTLRGPNYKVIEEKDLKLDNMGSAVYNYSIPKDAMLGSYSIQAKLNEEYFSTNVNIEAFKTPEFEVKLQKNKEGVKFGKPFEVQGNAKYYYGIETSGAKVVYTVEKSNFFPIFWRAPKIFAPVEKVKEGQTTTDKNGNFKITFTPEDKGLSAANRSIPARYIVNVAVTDKTGNTISAEEEYIVSGKESFFDIKNAKGFFRQATQNTIEVNMLNVNGEELEGAATARIYEAAAPKEWDQFKNTDEQLEKGKIIRIDPIQFKIGEATQFVIPPLKEGWYILELTPQGSQDASDNDNIAFMVVNVTNPAINIPANSTILESKTYYPGENAYILLASPKAQGKKYVELYKDQFLLSKYTLAEVGPVIMTLPIKEEYQGGITLQWLSVYNYQFFNGEVNIETPYVNSKLNLELSGDEISLPGSKKTIGLSVTDENKNLVDARAIVTIYDKALDYYKEHNLNTLNAYALSFGNNPITNSLSNQPRYFGGVLRSAAATTRGGSVKSLMYKQAMPMANDAMMESAVVQDSAAAAGEGGNKIEFRSDFSPNALWLPDLNVSKGSAEFTFTLPQSVGQWNVLAAAFTKNVKTGKTDFNFVTKKDLMINLEAPRFLRNGDDIELQALITNTTDKAMPAEVKLTINHSCSDKIGSCQIIEYPAKNVMLAAGGQAIVKWPFKAPQEGNDIMFSASAKNATLNDGEIKTIPLLPSLQQLTSSRTISLQKGTNKLFLGGVNKNDKIEAVHLTISPSLLMPVINAMPFLTKASPTLATYVADSYLPLAIFDKLYNDYPQLKEAVAKLPKRDSVSPAWNINEDMLLNNVAGSPWYLLAKGYNQKQAVLSLFDAKLVADKKLQAEKDLAKFQNQDGGYAWIKGGQSNMFITLNVLESFAQAYSYGVKIDDNTAKKALNYVISKNNDKDINLSVYMAYILTAFPKEWNAKSYELAKNTMSAFEKDPIQTPLSYAYAAAIYKRLGDMDKAKLQIERLFDMSTSSDITGIAWTMEARTWQWFEDGITLHAAALKVLNEIDPQDPRINGLVKWLIFNEKAEAWGNPQSAAKAVYSLMGIMIKDGVLEQTKIFTTEWNGKTTKVTVAPYDLDSSRLTISAYGDEITPDVFKAAINKSVLTMEKPLEDIDDYATITALFTSETPEASSQGGLINVEKEYYHIKNGKAIKLKEGSALSAGDEVQVRLTIKADSAFDFVVVSDPKPAAFEADELLSGWKYDGQLSRYEELKSNVTNFFLNNLPRGTYELKYTLRPTSAGTFTSGAAVIQSMFMPEVTAHSAGFKVRVK